MALLNLDNIPSGMISGLDTEMLEWVTNESEHRKLTELSGGFLNYLESEEIDIEDIPEDLDLELKQLEISSIPKSTKQHMDTYSRRFLDFLQAKNLSQNLELIPKSILNNYLRYFFSELRTKSGEYYSAATLVCIRAGLYRYFSTNLNRNDINIIADKEFRGSNQMLKSMVLKYKRSNKPKQEEKYPAIEPNDIVKIRTFFDRSAPKILQEEIIYILLYFFHLRGRETLPHINKENISIETDSCGKRYLRINCDMLSKNAKASLCRKEFEHAATKRVYENCDDRSECPVTAFEIYFDKIKHCSSNSLFPKPCKTYNHVWYSSMAVVGKNTFDTFLSNLSSQLELSKRYTNHCLRVTGITILKEAGKSNEEIASETGHKSALSVQRYVRKRKDASHYGSSNLMNCGFSKIPTTVVPVGEGKIIVQEKKEVKEISYTAENSSSRSVNLQFNGTFNNCVFHI